MNCLDEGLLQALIDGELPAESKREAEAHMASCRACAAASAEAARESALFSRAFAVEGPLTVPTERLRASLASAIAEMQPAPVFGGVAGREKSGGRARSFWSSLAASLAPRRAAAFAAFALAAVLLGALFFALRPDPRPGKDGQPEMAKGTGAPTPVTAGIVAPAASPTVEKPDSPDAPGGATAVEEAKIVPKGVRPEAAKNQPKIGPPQLDKTGPRTPRPIDKSGVLVAAAPPRPKTPRPDLLPVERRYAREIAALRTSIERQKLQTLSPTLRAEYERNVAVVDEAIASTRAAVKSNPADKDAQEFLRAAYQGKLDLLSAVAGKSQLAAVAR